ncbi:hypothetical protein ACLI1A_08540 [Flavobacterium sp. RHBU_3]|uniref:hypothetical protein n=1 Tax=Flavobacterium sp. RHBU_3 TaxID=3391184 RepID=UPI003984D2AD
MNHKATKESFIKHLDDSLLLLVDFTGRYCYNTISTTFMFIIEPSGYDYHSGMHEFEKQNFDRILLYDKKQITKDALVDLLHIDEHIPNWINICIDQSTSKKTVIRVLAAREWRTFKDALEDYPTREIFHSTVSIPTGVEIDSGNFKKYDVNLFRKQRDLKSGKLLLKLKWLLRH